MADIGARTKQTYPHMFTFARMLFPNVRVRPQCRAHGHTELKRLQHGAAGEAGMVGLRAHATQEVHERRPDELCEQHGHQGTAAKSNPSGDTAIRHAPRFSLVRAEKLTTGRSGCAPRTRKGCTDGSARRSGSGATNRGRGEANSLKLPQHERALLRLRLAHHIEFVEGHHQRHALLLRAHAPPRIMAALAHAGPARAHSHQT